MLWIVTVILGAAGYAADVMLAEQGHTWTPAATVWMAVSLACFAAAAISFVLAFRRDLKRIGQS